MSCPRLFKKLFQNDGASRMLRPDIIPASQDMSVSSIVLNQFSTAGEYLVTGSKTIAAGYPEDTTDDIYLKVITTGDTVTQYYLHNGTLLGRYKDTAGAWSDWKEVGTNYDSQITALDERVTTNTDNLSTAIARIDDVTNWESTAQMHNNIYRGANLLDGHFGTISDFISAVSAGDFSDIYLGDYVTATYDGSNTTKYRVAAINLLNARAGTWGTTKPNVCIVPDGCGSSYMNSTDTAAGAYVSSYMYKTKLPALYKTIGGYSSSPFYGHVLSTTESFANATSTSMHSSAYSGYAFAESGCGEYTVTLCLMSPLEIYGDKGWGTSQAGQQSLAIQLPMFRVNPASITLNGALGFWTRAVVSSGSFCYVSSVLSSAWNTASLARTVRPRFFIG